VVVYVGPEGARAASAGVFITYAAHVAAMAPGTRIGSASPVTLGGPAPTEGEAPPADGQPSNGETMARKVTNDAVSQIKNLAQLRNRNAAWAESAVRDAANVTADEAVRLAVVDLVAPSVPDLLARIDGRSVRLGDGTDVVLATNGASIRTVEMGWMAQLWQLLADPTVAYILLSLGSLGLFLELSNPGAILPGVVGGIFLLLALYSLGTLPVDWTGVLLIGFAFVLFAVDLFVPSFGSLTIGGVVSFVLGSYLLIGGDAPAGFAIAEPVIWTMTALLVALFLFIGGSVVRARLRRPTTGRESLLGAVGTVRRAIDPAGMVFMRGELWSATAADDRPIAAGTSVAVTTVDGLRLVVRPIAVPEGAGTASLPGIDPRVVVPVTEHSGATSGGA
jgi:membrane-bound serine protease (ClpP class)